MMKTEKNDPSVIAKLMGLDEAPYKQQPVYGQRRVLSDNYLQKAASIGSRAKRSRNSRPKIKENSMINDSSKDASCGYIEEKRHSLESMQGIIDSRNSKEENGKLVKGTKESNALIEFTSPTKIAVLRPNLGNVRHASRPSFLLDSQTTFGWEFKKQLLERSKRTKVCQEIWSSRSVLNLRERPSVPELESKQISELETQVDISSNQYWKDKSVTTKLPIFKRFNASLHPKTKSKKMSKVDLKSRSGSLNDIMSPTSFKDVELSCGDVVIKQITEQIACNDTVKEGCFSCSSDVTLKQDSPCEDEFASLNCIDINAEVLMSTDEVYQPSPNSVLEPDNSSSSENGDNVSTDLNGLWMKLQILKSESEENQSDGDATEKSSSCVDENTKPVRCFGPKESQEFSYLVTVLNESGFHSGNVEVSFERWHSPERLANPLVFETLEKKYGKQESWSKTDRRLLFDRINLGLSEIIRPHIDFPYAKSLRIKLSTTLRRDIVEEELWKLLRSQENEINATVSEKAIGKELWLELADEMESIVEEIEAFLLKELATEIVAV